MRSYCFFYFLTSSVCFQGGQSENTRQNNLSHRRLSQRICLVPSRFLVKNSRFHSPKHTPFNKPSKHTVRHVALPVDAEEPTKMIKSKPNKSFNARSVAIAALTEMSHRNSSISEPQYYLRKLEADPKFLLLEDQRDRSFARNLVGTTERRLGQIDKVLMACCQGYPPKKKAIQACLRAGVTQLLFLNTPPFAAVKETVDVLRMPGFQTPDTLVKFVNAVLRTVSREGTSILEKQTSPSNNVSPWLLQELEQTWGVDHKNKILDQMMMEPPIYLTPKLPLGCVSRDEQRTLLENFCSSFNSDTTNHLHILPNGSLRAEATLFGHVSSWPLYNDGKWWVQDASSTIPALALIKTLFQDQSDVSTLHVVDFCAAPGGKTAQLISAGFGRVTAIESNERRSKRLRENLKRLNLHDSCNIIVADGRSWSPPEKNDISGILLDVPCSSTGTGARHGSVLRKTNNLSELLEIQESLANHCANILPVHGVMIYSTCSLLKQESEHQVEKLLKRGDLETIPFQRDEILGFDDAIDDQGWIRVLPGVLPGDLSKCDGFFVARLRKKL